MTDEEVKKMEYINENIIEKGYNPEDVANFVVQKTGAPFDSLSFDKLKEMVELFKDKGLHDTYSTVKKTEKKEKEKEKEKEKQKEKENKNINALNPLYSFETFEFETDYQQENKLVELYRNNNLISISVTEPQKEGKTGIFSKTYTTYRVQCPQLESDVRRTYADFEWLRNMLLLRYPLRIIPPIYKENVITQIGNVLKLENEQIAEEKKTRYLNQFMGGLIKKIILRTSPILYEFLVLNTELFKKYVIRLNKKKFELNINLTNFLTMKGKIKCEINENSVIEVNKNMNKYNVLCDIYNRMDSCISNLVNDFQNINLHTSQLSELFSQLNTNISQYQSKNAYDMKNAFTDFTKIFHNWSNSFGKQAQYFNKDFKEIFHYFGLEINEMKVIFKKYNEFKSEYETFTSMINKKKEQLFTSKKIDNWGVEIGTEDEIPNYIDDKKVAFQKMLYKENILLREEKKRVACTIHYIYKQFERTLKNQNERIKKFYDSMKENAKIVFGNDVVLKELLEATKTE